MDFSRNELIWGKEKQLRLKDKKVYVFGLGGVGGFALESLARAGVSNFTIVDFDEVSESNLNRQIIALTSTIGCKKTELFKQRLLDINADIKVNCVCDFYSEKLRDRIFKEKPDYVVDAIDTMRSKIDLLVYCKEIGIPVITSMGAGNRLDPTQLYISDISEIENKKCTFTKNVLYQLKKRGIESGIPAVTSKECPNVLEKVSVIENIETNSGEKIEFTKITPGSTPFVPAVAGYLMGYWVVKELITE